MARVITFSRRFPVTHPKKGQPTHFINSLWNSPSIWPGTVWLEDNSGDIAAIRPEIEEWMNLESILKTKKNHTIRAGQRHKAGDFFSPRVWSEGPYQSPQVKIGADTRIVKTWNIYMDLCPDPEHYWLDVIFINGEISTDVEIVKKLAKNDGLSEQDFRDWFKKPFSGQIICWNEAIEYK